ncbi:hypothetical protein E4Z66_03575 [Aliishimia ponticola]|uniref:Uncharacterized protein n=1 Tax=Aliishimia ponticola TaxID=2499833 RepID=A0A4S4NK61_9RHOB|nr:hypothetical protein [Aliishimia ponticola]THH38661.1 hypothetical protein E4Z66_03575 [Aliishimia ponticola]
MTKPDRTAMKPRHRDPPGLNATFNEDGKCDVDFIGDWGNLKNAYQHTPIITGVVSQIAALGSQGKQIDEGAANFALSFVDAMDPQDPAEVLLLTQMAATHQATMMLARRLNHVDNIPQQDSAERALNKLARTYAAQMDTLKKYRTKGQQVVRVERVTVEDGGQAIVGAVDAGGRSDGKM